MSGGRIRLDEARWLSAENTINAATAAPTASTNGFAIPDNWHGQEVQVGVAKSNQATIDIWGYATAIVNWLRLDRMIFTESVNEGQRLQDLTAFSRIYLQRVDTNTQSNTGCNIYLGVGEG